METKSSNEDKVGFVDGLFEMYKLREEIRKARAEIISESVMSSYNHKFGSFLFGTHLHFRSTIIDNAILPKKLELDLKKKIEASRLAYKFLIMQHAALKCILEQKYDRLINVTIYDKFISPYSLRRHSQYAIVALTRSGTALANQELLLAFIARRNNWIRKQALAVKNKEDQLKKKLTKMQQPTADAIKEQLPKKVVESALKNSSNKKQKRKG